MHAQRREAQGVTAGALRRFQLAGDEVVDLALERRQRERAVREDRIVEVAHVESFAEFLLGARSELADLHETEVVAQRLSGPRDVAVDLGRHLVQRQRGVGGEIVDRPLAAPAERVNAGIDDQARGAPGLVAEPAEVAVRIGVEAGL